jgi:hypothetical protein
MNIQSPSQAQFGRTLNVARKAPAENQEAPANKSVLDRVGDFWDNNNTAVNLGGGALVGAGLASLVGLPSEAVMSAAGSGALAGFFAGSKEKALKMAGGAALGAGIATMAGVPGAAVMGAAGTGTLLAWLFT